MSFQRYPLAMNHPGYKPAVVSQDKIVNKERVRAEPGRPASFPPITVYNEDQEQEYAAKGYLPAGISDAEAYRRAKAGVINPERPEFQEYPKCLYQKDDDGELVCKIVNSPAEEGALGKGWHSSPACNDAEEAEEGGEQEEAPRQKRQYRKRQPKTVVTPVQVGE